MSSFTESVVEEAALGWLESLGWAVAHAPAQGATLLLLSSVIFHESFQSTPPRRGRREGCRMSVCGASFNPRPRAGGDKAVRVCAAVAYAFQSTPPRRGRPCRFMMHPPQLVSIHAPAQGATTECRQLLRLDAGFQSTPPRRGRPLFSRHSSIILLVSIHAPAQGAT